MNEFTADAFVNRAEPVPVLSFPVSGTEQPSSDTHKGKRERLKESLSGSKDKLKEKLHDVGSGNKDYGYSLQDRLFTK